jgi:hypothetical protein
MLLFFFFHLLLCLISASKFQLLPYNFTIYGCILMRLILGTCREATDALRNCGCSGEHNP